MATEFPPNAPGGGPAVVRQMLKEWPAQDLLWWSCLPERDSRFGQRVQELRCAAIPGRLYPNRRFAAAKSAVLEAFWARIAALHLARTLRVTKPDVVWLLPHNWSILPAARVLGCQFPRYHVSVQDYVDVHSNPQRFGVARCRRMAAMADELYARAATRDATSRPMITDLLGRTGRPAAQMLHAGLEPADFNYLKTKRSQQSAIIRLAYAGTILVESVFELFVAAVESIRGALAKPVELHLFGAHTYAGRPWFSQHWMVEHGNLAEPELRAKLRECDWGFAPMASTDHDPRYNRFSFPTKFISYLAAGLPVITMGHAESSVMKMAAQYDVGICTSAGNADALAAELESALSAPSQWERHREAIIQCAQMEFDAARMRETLYRCFSTCAELQVGPRWT